jgi:hypothetical protein
MSLSPIPIEMSGNEERILAEIPRKCATLNGRDGLNR